MRNLELRNYQVEPVQYCETSDKCVLAAAPGAGKTEMCIEVIQRYLRKNPTHKVLVLSHNTNVVLDNFYDRLEELNLNFTYSKDFSDNSQVHVGIPQNEVKIKNQYQFVVVDEAHENYLAARVQRIVNASKVKKQLLLTGTPSRFIKQGGFDIKVVAANTIAAEYFAKLNIELVASGYEITDEDYNVEENLRDNYTFNEADTEATLANIIEQLIFRLKKKMTPEQFNNPSFIDKMKNWLLVYGEVGKTIIMCKSIKQANQAYEILLKKGINVAISHSENDTDSELLVKFKNNEYSILIVVNRARLAYSDDNLFNVIDMTASRNPDLIYQMFARVLRGGPQMQKYYLKVTPKDLREMYINHMAVAAALMLTDEKYLSTYNGRNFNGLEIPIARERVGSSGVSGGGSSSTPTREEVVRALPEFTHDVIDTFKNIICDLNKDTSIYKTTTIGEVRRMLGDMDRLPKGHWTFERCAEEALKYISRLDFQKGNGGAYGAALKNNWLDEICSHMVDGKKPNNYWDNKPRCAEEALKYKNKKKFQRNSRGAYSAAKRNGWVDEICAHMKYLQLPNNYWTKQRCAEEAKKYNIKSYFRKGSGGAYSAAYKNGWLDEICAHMTGGRKKKKVLQEN